VGVEAVNETTGHPLPKPPNLRLGTQGKGKRNEDCMGKFEKYEDELEIRTAGNVYKPEKIYGTPRIHLCGPIVNGVSFRFPGEAGFVIEFDDLEAFYKVALKYRQDNPDLVEKSRVDGVRIAKFSYK
jgi:hypothetical protein